MYQEFCFIHVNKQLFFSLGLEHAKEYVELLMSACNQNSESYFKLLQFLSHGVPFWEQKHEKRYVVVTKKRKLLSKKANLSAIDKLYLLLKKKFGKKFATHAVEEVQKFGKSNKFEETIDLLDDPTEKKYHKTWEEAKACKYYLTKKYMHLNKYMKSKFKSCIKFEIEERNVESEETEEKFLKNMHCIDPIIPYEKNSLMYKQAVKSINEYLNPQPKCDDKVYIEYTNPRVAIRLLNTIVNLDKVVFYSDDPIRIEEIAEEMVNIREKHTNLMEGFKDKLRMRKNYTSFHSE